MELEFEGGIDEQAEKNSFLVRVKDAILKTGQVETDRLFVAEPKFLSLEKKEKLKESRVDFSLKQLMQNSKLRTNHRDILNKEKGE